MKFSRTPLSLGMQLLMLSLSSVAAHSAAVAGQVTDAATHAAIANAKIKVGSASGTTSSTGSYRIIISPGTYAVTASAAGYNAASQTFTVGHYQTATVNLALTVSPPAPGAGGTIAWNGHSSYLLGANYPWYNYGTDFGTGGWGKFTDWNSVAADFARMHAQGVRLVRWWVFADGRYAPDFNSDGTVSGLDSSVLTDVDRALQIAASDHIFLLLTVIDGSMWSAGSWSGTVHMGGHAAIVTNSTVRQSFLDKALKPLLQHVAASPNRSAVLGYDLVNEPEAQMATYWGGSNLDPNAVHAFISRCASYVHTYGGGAYATVGSATPYYVVYLKGLGLDFYQLHYYPWMDFNHGAGTGLPTYASLKLDKPCVVGEFPTADASYGANDTNPLSARWYLDAIYSKGYAGALGWAYLPGDSATNWRSFQPIFTAWANSHSNVVGP